MAVWPSSSSTCPPAVWLGVLWSRFNNVRPKGDGGKGETIAYAKCRHLLRYRHATYFFLNEQAAFIFPDGCIKGQSPAEFQAFLSSRTGKPCQTLYPWLSASLWSIIRQKKAG